MRLQNIVGNRYGMLVVVNREVSGKGGNTRWLCKCDCGNTTIVYSSSLKRGYTKSCGCNTYNNRGNELKKENRLLYGVWKAMRWRCYGKPKNYMDYGGRGIKLCKEWHDSFDAFCKWSLENGYKEGLTIDRIDNNGIYSPDNCRWTDRKTQARNRRSSIIIKYNGEEKTLPDWCDALNLPYERIIARYKTMRTKSIEIDTEKLFYNGNLKKRSLK